MATRTQIANVCQRTLGQARITDLDDASDPQAVELADVFDARNEALQGRDWNFNRTRAQLTRVVQITVDTAPTPAAFAVGATLTGAVSGVTAVVKKVISATVYWVTSPSGDFTASEVIGDGTNGVDCADGYPVIDLTPIAFGGWRYCFAIPDDCVNPLKLIDEHSDRARYRHAIEDDFVYSDYSEAFFLYNRLISDVSSINRGWYGDLLGKDLAGTLVTAVIGDDQYLGLRVEKKLARAWLDALSANGREGCYVGPFGDVGGGSSKVYGNLRQMS